MKSSFKRNFKAWHWVTVCVLAVTAPAFVSSLRSSATSPAYTITDLGTLGGSPNQSRAYGINNCGTTVGDSMPPASSFNHAFYKKGATMTDIPSLGAEGSGYSLNSFGYTVGYSNASIGQRAFLWHDDDDDGVSDPGELNSFLPAGAIGVAYEINDSNRVVGLVDTSGGSSLSDSAFVWDATNGLQILPGVTGLSPTRAQGINNAGTIAGWAVVSLPPYAPTHAFILKNNTYINLGTLDNSTLSLSSFAWRISEDNHVVGYSQIPSGNALIPIHPFVWFDTNNNNTSDAGEMQDLGTLSGTNAYGYDINASGYVVGTSEVTGGATHGYVWHDDNGNGVSDPGEMKDLNTQFADATWTTLVEARSINDGGQIVGWGTKSNGETHAFLLTPSGFVPPACPTASPSPSPTPTPATTTLISVQGNGTYGGTATLSATLYSNDQPVSGKTISFTLNSTAVCGGSTGVTCPTTNASGIATLSLVSLAGVNAGSYPTAVGASFAGDSSYAATNQNGPLTVSKASQAITVNTHAPASAPYNSQFTVAATASSGLAVTYTSSGACTNTGANFTMTSGTGTCSVIFNQAGNSNYNGAGQITENVTAQKASQTITVNTHAPTNAAYNSQFTVAATSSSGLGVSYSGSGGCTNAGATFTMTSATTACSVKYDQAGDTNFNAASQVTESVTAQKANQTITVNTHAPTNAAYNSQFTVAASASSGLGVSYSSSGACTNSGATFTITSGSGTCSVKYDQAGDGNYNAASQVTEGVTAQKATATITLANLTQIFDGSPKFATASTNPSGLTVTLTYSQNGNPVSSPTAVGAYAVSAVINDANYQGSTTGTLNIVEPAPAILLEMGTSNAAALDSVTYVRSPFRVTNNVNFSSDHVTRIIIFTLPLGLTSPPIPPTSTLSVQASGINLPVEAVGNVTGVTGLNASYIVVSLVPGMPTGDLQLTVTRNGVVSNAATLTIIP